MLVSNSNSLCCGATAEDSRGLQSTGSFTRIHHCHGEAMDFTNWMPDAPQNPVVLRDTDVAYRPDPVTEVHGYHPI